MYEIDIIVCMAVMHYHTTQRPCFSTESLCEPQMIDANSYFLHSYFSMNNARLLSCLLKAP